MLSAVAALAAGRGRVDTAYQHNPSARFTVAPHAHADLLQLDLIDGCIGECHTGGAWRGIAGLTALLSRPGETHGYALDPLPGAAVVHHLKLRITDISAWPLFDGGFLRPCARGSTRPATCSRPSAASPAAAAPRPIPPRRSRCSPRSSRSGRAAAPPTPPPRATAARRTSKRSTRS